MTSNVKILNKLQQSLKDLRLLAKMISEPGRSPGDIALISNTLRQRVAGASALLRASMEHEQSELSGEIPENPNEPRNLNQKTLPQAPKGAVANGSNKKMIHDDQIEETTSMASGIQGSTKPQFQDKIDMRNVKESNDVTKFRKYIRTLLEQVYQQDKSILFEFDSNKMDFQPSMGGDNLIQNPAEDLMQSDAQDESLGSTGIEHLDELFNNIRPIIEKTYLRLKSSKDQRMSYAVHLKKAIQDQLDMLEMNVTAEVAATNVANADSNSSPVKTNVNSKLNSAELPAKDDEEARLRKFSVPGLNETGRNFALKTFDDIDEQIEKSFRLIGKEDKEDRENFKTYLLKNVVLLFKQLEEGMSSNNMPVDQQNIA